MIKKGDFVELNFTGKLDDGKIFDTTIPEVAKKNNIFQEKVPYEPVVVVVGERHIVPGLDDALVGKKPGKFSVKVDHEEAFGKKHAQLLKIIPMKNFKKQGIKPFVGMEVNIDGTPGVVRTVSGGRVIVDFNHPLAGKDIEYETDVKKILTTNKEKVEAVLNLMHVPFKDLKVEGKKGTIVLPINLPVEMQKQALTEIERLTTVVAAFKEEKKADGDKKKESKKGENAAEKKPATKKSEPKSKAKK